MWGFVRPVLFLGSNADHCIVADEEFREVKKNNPLKVLSYIV
jgi:hypothetical protein